MIESRKIWIEKNREKIKEQRHNYYLASKGNKITRKWEQANGNKSIIFKRWREGLKTKIYNILGNKCLKCDFDDWRALQIDHVNGGGGKDRRKLGPNFLNHVLRSLEAKEGKYQLLCANCNFIKRYENNECRYTKEVN